MLSAQNITVDGFFEDWKDVESYSDPLGDALSNRADFTELSISDTEDFLFIYFTTTNEINIQNESRIALIFDLDNDLQTGKKINGVGAEFVYNIGDRVGRYYADGDDRYVNHFEINFISAPTVSSDRFEIMIDKRSEIAGKMLFNHNNIAVRLEDNATSGDDLPDGFFGVAYTMTNKVVETEEIDLSKTPDHIRVLSYNVERDQLFDDNTSDSYARVFKSVDADIIAFQEIYDKNGRQTRDHVNNLIGEERYPYVDDGGVDVIILSKYPIIKVDNIDGNAAFFLDVDDKSLVMFNIHLPCCDNDQERRSEVDAVMRYLRKIKEKPEIYGEDNAILILGDTNFVGDNDQLHTILTGDIYNNNSYGPDFKPDADGTDLSYIYGKTLGVPATITWYDDSSFCPGRLDYIFYSDANISIGNNFVINSLYLNDDQLSAININKFDTYINADHLPVVADIKIDFTVGTDDITFEDLNAFPNPATETIYLNNGQGGRIYIYDAEGKQLMHKTIDAQASLDVTTYASGTYFLTFYSENGKVFKGHIKVIR